MIPRAEAERMAQVRVAAALREAAALNGWWLSINAAGEPDGTFCSVQPHDDPQAEKYVQASRILALIPHSGKALDRMLAAERERCARVADQRKGNGWDSAPPTHPYDKGYIAACDAIAAAIRARTKG
jgi:hypothetical protein